MEKHLRALRFTMALLVVAIVALIVWLLTIDEAALSTMIDRSFGYGAIPDYPDKLPLPTRQRLVWAACSWASVAGIVAAWPWLARALFIRVSGAWQCGRAAIARTWVAMPKWERWCLSLTFIACTAMRIAFAIVDPPVLDEALNWLLFGERGPLVALMWYAAPNNHIGHTLMASIIGLLPVDPLLALRTPSIMAAGLAQGVLYLFLRRICGPAPAFLAVAFAMASPLVLYYDHLGRGYAMVVLAFATGFGAAALWLRTKDPRALQVLTLVSVLGVFVMPSALYGCGPLLGSLLLFSDDRLRVLRAAAWAIVGIAVLYAPSLIVSGTAAFMDNPWVRPAGRATLAEGWWPHMKLAFEGLTGIRSGFFVALSVLLLAPAITSGQMQRLASIALSVVALALVLPFIHGVLPFERTLIYLIVPLAAAIGMLGQRLLPAGALMWLVVPVSLTLFGIQATRLRRVLPSAEVEAFRAAQACSVLRSAKPAHIIGVAQPLAAYAFFDFQRGRYPSSARFEVMGAMQSPAPSGAAFIGWKPDLSMFRGDSILFSDDGLDAIWIIGPASSP